MFYGHLLVWHPVCFTHMTYLHINLSWQGEVCSFPVTDRLNQWDTEPRAVSWTKFTLQSSENTMWTFSSWCFQCISTIVRSYSFLCRECLKTTCWISPGFFSLSVSMGSWRCESDDAGVWKKSFLAGDGVHWWNFCCRLRLIDLIIWNDIFKVIIFLK